MKTYTLSFLLCILLISNIRTKTLNIKHKNDPKKKEIAGSSLKPIHSIKNNRNVAHHNDLLKNKSENDTKKLIKNINKTWLKESLVEMDIKRALKIKNKLIRKLAKIIRNPISTPMKKYALLASELIQSSYEWKYKVENKGKSVSKSDVKNLVNFTAKYMKKAEKKGAKKVVNDSISKLAFISTNVGEHMQLYIEGQISKLKSALKKLLRKVHSKNTKSTPVIKPLHRLLQQLVVHKAQNKKMKLTTAQVMGKMNGLLANLAHPKIDKTKKKHKTLKKSAKHSVIKVHKISKVKGSKVQKEKKETSKIAGELKNIESLHKEKDIGVKTENKLFAPLLKNTKRFKKELIEEKKIKNNKV